MTQREREEEADIQADMCNSGGYFVEWNQTYSFKQYNTIAHYQVSERNNRPGSFAENNNK